VIPPEVSCCDVWASIQKTPFLQQSLEQKKLQGEFDAPIMKTSPTRICTIDPRGAVINIQSIYCKDGEIYADYTFVSEDMHKLIESNECYLRARVLINYNETCAFIESIRFVTIDIVKRR
jgi:hypothetical protein